MILASDYPFLDVLWTMLVFFGWVIWFWLLIVVFSDVFRRSDLSGWGKAGWVVLTIILPFVGVLIYLIAHGKDMGERRAQDIQAQQSQLDQHIRSVAGGGGGNGAAAEIAHAKSLLDSGAINQAEYEQLKAKALA
jgi:putative oligomerization/nucleic acid binding protein/phospholipase D-like protein